MVKYQYFAPEPKPVSAVEIITTRIAAGLSLPEAAKMCEVSESQWIGWESGQAQMPHLVWLLFKILLQK